MPRILNKHRDGVPPGAVYVGRPSKWGNPWSHHISWPSKYRVATRRQAIARYRAWIAGRPDLQAVARRELRGKDLVCWCAPARCHAEVLMEIANAPELEDREEE